MWRRAWLWLWLFPLCFVIAVSPGLAFYEFPICTALGHAALPVVSGDFVIWTDGRNDPGDWTNLDIYGYEISTGREFAICTASGSQGLPAVSGDTVVWTDGRNDPGDWTNLDIYGCDLVTGEEFAICTASGMQGLPVISGNFVIWTDGRNDPGDGTNLDIYGYNLSTHQEFPVCTAPGDQGLVVLSANLGAPAISGNTVVWTDGRHDPGDWTNLDVYGCNLTTGSEFPICTEPGNQGVPVIAGNTVVWTDGRNDPGDWSNLDVYAYDLSTGLERAICIAAGHQGFPAISGNRVVWTDGRDDRGNWTNLDIYGYDLSTGQEFTVCKAPGIQGLPFIRGDRVLWTDARDDPGDWTNLDIYGIDLSGGGEFLVCGAPGLQGLPVVAEGMAVWTDGRTAEVTGADIYAALLDAQVPSNVSFADFEERVVPWAHFIGGPGGCVAWRDPVGHERAHSGLHVAAADVTDQAIAGFWTPLPTTASTVSLRTWVCVDTRAGTGTSSTFIGFSLSEDYPSSATGWGQALGWEVLSANASLYQLAGLSESSGVGLPAGSWHLVQVEYKRATASLKLWLDGELIAERSAPAAGGQAARSALLGALGSAAQAREVVHFDDTWVTVLGELGSGAEIPLCGVIEGREFVAAEQDYIYAIRYGSDHPMMGNLGAATKDSTAVLAKSPDQVFLGLTLGEGYGLLAANPPATVISAAGNPAWALPEPTAGEWGEVQVQLSTPAAGTGSTFSRSLWLWVKPYEGMDGVPPDPPQLPQTPPTDLFNPMWGFPPDHLPQFLVPQLTPDLWILKKGPRFAAAGDTINYILSIGNSGFIRAHDVAVVDEMPELLGGGERVVARLAALDVGETWKGVVSGWLPWEVAAGLELRDVATVTGTPVEVNTENNSAVWLTTTVVAVDPNRILVYPEGGVDRGEQLTYTLECENIGAGTAYGVYVVAPLDGKLDRRTVRIASPMGLSYDLLSHTLVWEVGTLLPDESRATSYTVRVAEDAPRARPVIGHATVYFPSVPEETATNTVVNIIHGSFPDVLWNHWAVTYIEVAYEAGIVSGYPDGTYAPDAEVDRAQMAVYICRGLGLPTQPYQGQFPDDVPITQWAWPWIEALAREEIVQGFDATHYDPDRVVNRDAMAVYVARALEGGPVVPSGPAQGTFEDVPDYDPGPAHWAYDEIEYCVAHHVVQGYPDGLYHPVDPCRRDQMAVYVQRAFGLPL